MNPSSCITTQQGKPLWLDMFLRRTFFNTCSIHNLCKNDMNKYCIDCDQPACQYCVATGSHDGHKILKIYRHVYKDVVPLNDMENHIDCSKIQPYKCNKQWVLPLTPLPHCGSGSQTDRSAACDVCMRILNDPITYRYCCISCKVEAFSKKKTNSEPPFLTVETLASNDEATTPINGEDQDPFLEEAGETKRKRADPIPEEVGEMKRKRARKGMPHKAPMF